MSESDLDKITKSSFHDIIDKLSLVVHEFHLWIMSESSSFSFSVKFSAMKCVLYCLKFYKFIFQK